MDRISPTIDRMVESDPVGLRTFAKLDRSVENIARARAITDRVAPRIDAVHGDIVGLCDPDRSRHNASRHDTFRDVLKRIEEKTRKRDAGLPDEELGRRLKLTFIERMQCVTSAAYARVIHMNR